MKYSIVVVSYNAGNKLKKTVESILSQTYAQYEIIIKDAGSSDGSLENVPDDNRIKKFVSADRGIYDGMNEAVKSASGDYVLFLNCGDYFIDNYVLEEVNGKICKTLSGSSDDETNIVQDKPYIFYGNIYNREADSFVRANPVIDDFACFRNLPCHQACFYSRSLFETRGFDISYKVRADYEHFLWCYYKAAAKCEYLNMTVASYEGGGLSDSPKGRKISKEEHKKILPMYLPSIKIIKYRAIMLLTLAPLRTRIAESRLTSGLYNSIKSKVYESK